MLRKRVLVVAVVGIAIAGLGWGSASSFGSSSHAARNSSKAPALAGKLTLMWTSQQLAVMQKLVSGFERKYPKVHVVLSGIDASALTTVLTPLIQAGNPPDLAYAAPGKAAPFDVESVAPKLLRLTGPWTTQLPAVFQSPEIGYDGKTGSYLAAPLGIAPEGIVYNQTLFSALGLHIPTTFSQVLGLCAKINAAGKTPFGFSEPVSTPFIYMNEAAPRFVFGKDPNWIAQRVAGKVSFSTSAGWRKVIADWQAMVNAKCFSPGAAGQGLTEDIAGVAHGTTVMDIDESPTIGEVEGVAPGIHLGMFDMPGDNTSQRGAVIGLIANIMAFKTHHAALQQAFINFLMTAKELQSYSALTGTISPADWAKRKLPAGLAPIAADAKYSTTLAPGNEMPSQAWLLGGTNPLIELMTGQLTTVSQVLAALDKAQP